MNVNTMHCLSLLAVALTASQAAGSSEAADPFEITVFRQYKSDTCTSGYIAAEGKIICYSLEKPWKGNAPEISSIPAGTYTASLRYDHKDRWRVELKDVPGRKNIQIHIGNTPADSKGCILVGAKLNPDLCSVQDSAVAYRALKKAFYGTEDPKQTPDREIRVCIKDQ